MHVAGMLQLALNYILMRLVMNKRTAGMVKYNIGMMA